jgi:hypothetical protein
MKPFGNEIGIRTGGRFLCVKMSELQTILIHYRHVSAYPCGSVKVCPRSVGTLK